MSELVGVILAAGYGTRFLPVTRVVPKELLPLVDRPALDVVVQELVEAGCTSLVVVTSRRKSTIDAWFDHDVELESVFRREGAHAKLARALPPEVDVAMVRQRAMLGSGHAILQAAPFIGDRPFVVAYPDDLFGAPNCAAQLVETWRETGCSVLSAHDMPNADLSRYGVLDVDGDGPARRVRRLVEKPAPGTAPSSLVSLGRYLYTPEFLDALRAGWAAHTPAEGEYFPMAATNALAARGRMVARVVDAPRYDTGTPLGYLQAVTDAALARDDVGPAFDAWLRARLGADRG